MNTFNDSLFDGTRLPSRYKKVERIGFGGFGDVWKAYDNHIGEFVAIKFLKKLDPDSLKRFENEARELIALTQFTHVVTIKDYNISTLQPYIVMEYCQFGSLRNQIGKISPAEGLKILKAMIYALRPVHGSGGYHGDIKPDNILLALHGQIVIPKLSDFGLARTPRPEFSMTQSPRGTEPYKAPEIRLNLAYSSKADIYSLGITMFELLIGTPEIPFLLFTPGPRKFTNLLRQMTADTPALRPNINQIEKSLNEIENDFQIEGASKFLKSLSYGELTLGGAAIILILGGLFGGEK